jgi:hypothetical protein
MSEKPRCVCELECCAAPSAIVIAAMAKRERAVTFFLIFFSRSPYGKHTYGRLSVERSVQN